MHSHNFIRVVFYFPSTKKLLFFSFIVISDLSKEQQTTQKRLVKTPRTSGQGCDDSIRNNRTTRVTSNKTGASRCPHIFILMPSAIYYANVTALRSPYDMSRPSVCPSSVCNVVASYPQG